MILIRFSACLIPIDARGAWPLSVFLAFPWAVVRYVRALALSLSLCVIPLHAMSRAVVLFCHKDASYWSQESPEFRQPILAYALLSGVIESANEPTEL